MSYLELSGVRKSFGPAGARTEVLSGIDLGVERGEFVAIVGYSGSGKSTLINLIGGLLSPDAGRISLEGKPVSGPGHDRAVVFQNYSLLPWLTVRDNIALAVDQVFPGWTRQRREDHVQHHIDLVRLTEASRKRPHELSGGMRQRVALARALSMTPRVLLLDEPLGALDALTRAALQHEIERLWSEERQTVVLITNDVDEGLLLADRIIPLSRGPGAVLGPPVPVDLARPRDRKALNHDARFKAARAEIFRYLLGSGRKEPAREPAEVR
ncbi:MAG TPA: ABC transporter ATP-binding protein [Planctomycetota bacterium]|nr:ABC transporter ATP-binding protein [Planctomycetota bacterium]